MKDSFSICHPVINFLFFVFVLVFSMFITQPICQLIALVCSYSYAVYLNGHKMIASGMKYMIPLLLVSVIINPMFNHEGGTILMYLKDGNPLTLESIMYGVSAAVMIVTVITWFSSYNYVMTSDKFIYLFGRVIPALSLIISMALRFVPRFKVQLKVIVNTQRCIGCDVSQGSILERAKNGLKILSILTTWALENAIMTGDSMRSRGYGLPSRTAFSIYTFDSRDKKILLYMSVLISYMMIGLFKGGVSFRYFPTIKGNLWTPYSISLYLCYMLFCLSPLLLNIKEALKWKTLRSKI